VFEVGENLALFLEPLQHGIGVHAAFDHFDRNHFPELLVGALCQIDRAHSAAANLANHPIRAD
jgi:hypothetical protein